MRCEEARQELLRREPAELSGEADTPLARHVRGCGDCREVAAALLEGQRVLGRALDEAAAGADAGEAADRALRAVHAEEHAPGGREDDGAEKVEEGWRRWVVPLAAAAALVVALAVPLREDRDREPWPPADRPGPAPAALAVEATNDWPVTVLQTSDPDVVVVWFHAQREESGR